MSRHKEEGGPFFFFSFQPSTVFKAKGGKNGGPSSRPHRIKRSATTAAAATSTDDITDEARNDATEHANESYADKLVRQVTLTADDFGNVF